MKPFVFLLLLFPVFSNAQINYELAASVGADIGMSVMAIMPGPAINIRVDPNKQLGGNVTLKAVANTHKWQGGIGVEAGMMKGRLTRLVGSKYDYIDEVFLMYPIQYDRMVLRGQSTAGPYFTPHLFINYKVNFSDAVYAYIGPMGGMMFAKNDMSWDGFTSGWTAGANLGAVIDLNEKFGLDISAGIRQAFLRDNSTQPNTARALYNESEIIASTNGVLTEFYARAINEYDIRYLTGNVGVRYRL